MRYVVIYDITDDNLRALVAETLIMGCSEFNTARFLAACDGIS